MLGGWKCGVCFTLGIWAVLGVATGPDELFQESLIIRPLRDGKVASQFSFTTLVKDATPRNPETLGLEDDCESIITYQLLFVT
jgi:GPI-anchor transamidase subunit T